MTGRGSRQLCLALACLVLGACLILPVMAGERIGSFTLSKQEIEKMVAEREAAEAAAAARAADGGDTESGGDGDGDGEETSSDLKHLQDNAQKANDDLFRNQMDEIMGMFDDKPKRVVRPSTRSEKERAKEEEAEIRKRRREAKHIKATSKDGEL